MRFETARNLPANLFCTKRTFFMAKYAIYFKDFWSEWQNSNLRPPRPERDRLRINAMITTTRGLLCSDLFRLRPMKPPAIYP